MQSRRTGMTYPSDYELRFECDASTRRRSIVACSPCHGLERMDACSRQLTQKGCKQKIRGLAVVGLNPRLTSTHETGGVAEVHCTEMFKLNSRHDWPVGIYLVDTRLRRASRKLLHMRQDSCSSVRINCLLNQGRIEIRFCLRMCSLAWV